MTQNTEIKMTDEELRLGRKYIAWPLLCVLGLLFLREATSARTVLVSHVPIAWTWAACTMGLIFGLAVAFQFLSLPLKGLSKMKRALVAVHIVPMLVFATSYLGRWIYEIAAFVGSDTKTKSAQVKIMQANISSRSAGHRVIVKAIPDGREFNVFVIEQINREMGAIRPPLWRLDYAEQKYCVSLPLEYGRWGVIRAQVPAMWDEPIDTYVQCEVVRKEQK
jgi:hypothetical protein